MANGKKIFMKITNEMIYNELKTFKEQNQLEHQEIIQKHTINKGEIDIIKWIAGSSLALGVFISAGLLTKVL